MPKPALASSLQETMRSAQAHLDAGRPEEAMALYERVMLAVPNDPKIACAVASIAQHLGFAERAAGYMRSAIKRNRNIPDYHVYLGNALLDMGRLDEAGASLRQALSLKPHFAEAHGSLGAVLTRQRQPDAAIAHLNKAIEINPKLAAAHQNLGAALYTQGRMTDAIVSLRTAIALEPELGEAYVNLAKCLNFLPGAASGLIAEATRRWAGLLRRPGRRPPFTNDRNPDRKLRIGYVSGDFRTHAVTFFLESVLAAHDHAGVEVTCYSNNAENDQTTERLKTLADHWRTITGLKDEDAEALIRSDGIDILVDLSGHTYQERLALFARKPAPIQCTWLGYYATTGLPEIDYVIADRIIVPPEDEVFFTEKPWRMPDSYLCFTKPSDAPEVNNLPALRNGFVTFGSCNQGIKLNNAVIELWSRILRSLSSARLVLRARDLGEARARDEIIRKFAANGITEDRLTILGGGRRADFLGTYNSFDIALDPFPYAGGTTTMEALWMGVPVVGMRGNRFSGRVSESILTTIGLLELIVPDDAEYLAKAISLAQDLPRLSELRAKLRGMVASSPICDAPRFARQLEDAYRRMWANWCASAEQAA